MRTPSLLPLSLVLVAACVGKGNTEPGAPTVEITTVEPTTVDDLVASVTVEAVDPDGDPVTYLWSWTVDEADAGVAADTVPAGRTARGQVWTVSVVATDGELESAPATASVTILNTPPVAQQVTFQPETPTNADDIVAVGVAEDIDGDALTWTWTWTLDGEPIAVDGDTVIAARTDRWQVWTATGVASDGEASTEAVTAEVMVANAPPVVTTLALSAAEVTTDDVLEAVASGEDADGDAVGFVYTWTVDEVEVPVTGPLLDGALWFDKGQQVRVSVAADDGWDVGEPVTSDVVWVVNSPPAAPTPAIEPDPPVEGEDDAVCVLAVEAVDPDGDPVSYAISWEREGQPFTGATTTLAGDTVPNSELVRYESWTCTVTPTDGEAPGEAGVASFTVRTPVPPLEVDGVTVTLTEGSYAYGDVSVVNGGVLQIRGLVTLDAYSFEVDVNSSVSGVGGGGAAGAPGGPGGGPGGGQGITIAGASGGGYGGAGGQGGRDSSDPIIPGGVAYGDASSESIEAGSGGGGGLTDPGAAGGAGLSVRAAQIVVAGTVDMGGADAPTACTGGTGSGGGSGGGVMLVGDAVIVSGAITVAGGNGTYCNTTFNDSGGGGGGGRVKVFWDSSYSRTGTVDVSGGAGGPYGSANRSDPGSNGTLSELQQTWVP